jgi:imidazolonepropionase-like amidohydrolase
MRNAVRALFSLLLLACLPSFAQETATPNDVADERAGTYALVGATVTVAPGTVVEDAVVLIADGSIVTVTGPSQVPAGYATIDVSGRYIYPGLVDAHTSYGLPDVPGRAPFSFRQAEVLDSQIPGAFNANEAIKSAYDAVSQFAVDTKAAATWRSMGFGAVLTYMADGIARGSAALVTLGDVSDNEAVLAPRVAAMYSFDKGSSKQSFPVSPMGSVALLRQTFLDAQWYERQSPKPFTDESLQAWLALQQGPQIFDTRNWLELTRADKVGDEFAVQYIFKAGGDTYQRLEAIKATDASLIVPLEFPEAQDVDDPFAADRITLADLKHWELAPGNPAALEQAGINFAITSGGDAKQFWKRMRKAVEAGLSETQALAAVTTVPAGLLGQSERLGSLREGAMANLIVTSAPLFDDDAVIEENWVGGERYVVNPHVEDRSGVYALRVGTTSLELHVSGKPAKPKAEIIQPTADDGEQAQAPAPAKASLDIDADGVVLSFALDEDGPAIRLGGWIVGEVWSGEGRLGDGAPVRWRAERVSDLPAQDSAAGDDGAPGAEPAVADADAAGAADDADIDAPGPVIYPFGAYGTTTLPVAETLLIRNATVWTLEADGTLEGVDVLVRDGRIAAVGRNLAASGARVIDGTGKHLTPGIIDEHSHIALSGINDIATNSAMVRMADSVDSEDINIYRNLAGGVTAAQLLHGSANPIGGQSALVKMRWGSLPQEMLIEGADGFIKFALGENVKRSRNPASIRYPQTRMGVEQVFRDAFTAARDYKAAWDNWRALGRAERARTPAPRRDLVMDAMVEILQDERFISCHSYVQSEINMLMHVAEDFDFRVNTFTHILEGYKVADKMAAHGAAGSTFSDWWAYKWEVRYAIPYNAALMSMAGVTTAINSDDAEMSRRLNQEAAKSVKYGGMPEVEALKLVTLNPAIMLHLDDRMGSIRIGKDADLVIWSDHPLSIDARVQSTIVDGRVLYDVAENARRFDAMQAERARLIEKMRKAKADGGGGGGRGPGGPGGFPPPRRFECDSMHGYEYLEQAAGLWKE